MNSKISVFIISLTGLTIGMTVSQGQHIDIQTDLNDESQVDNQWVGPTIVSEEVLESISQINSGILREWAFPTEPIQGGTTGVRIVSFDPCGESELELQNRRLRLKTLSEAKLNNDYIAEGAVPVGFRVTNGIAGTFSDGVVIVPNDSSLNGQLIKFDFTVEIRGSLSATSASPSAKVRYAFGDNFENEYIGSLDSEGNFEGEVEFLGTQTAVFQGLAILANKQTLQEAGLEFGGGVEIEIGARSEIDANRGSAEDVLKAELELFLTFGRISNIRLDDGSAEGLPMDNSEFKSSSLSGFDYVGNGPPDDEPATEFSWDNASGGMFGTDTNWDVDAVPGSDDQATFALPGSYTVDVGAQEVKELKIGGDPSFNVEFTNADLTANSTGLSPPGTIVNNGIFTLSSGTVTTNHATFGSENATTVVLQGANTTWNTVGRLDVGPVGEINMEIKDGARVNSGETFVRIVEPSPGSNSSVLLSDVGSRWNIGNAQFWGATQTPFFVNNGAELIGDEVRIGVQPGEHAYVLVEGIFSGGITPSTFEAELLKLGKAAMRM